MSRILCGKGWMLCFRSVRVWLKPTVDDKVVANAEKRVGHAVTKNGALTSGARLAVSKGRR